jgi:CheY-like chemotaxis protein
MTARGAAGGAERGAEGVRRQPKGRGQPAQGDGMGMDERRFTGSVLVLEDEAPIRELVRQALEDEGCAVATAAAVAAALARLHRARAADAAPAVPLLDLRLPGRDGWGSAAAYRREPPPRAPVGVMTAAPDARAARRWAAEVGAAACQPKPFDLGEFLVAVGRFTDCVGR